MMRESIAKYAPSPDQDLMLQMDSEGAEYAILFDLEREILSRLRILVIKFHVLHRALVDPNVLQGVCLLMFEKISRDFICIPA
jgi:hypothetical protein